MENVRKYFDAITEGMNRIVSEEHDSIERAAELISESLRDQSHLLHVFGTGGHSIMAAEELFYRAGGLAQIDPIFFAGVAQINGGMKTQVERVPGLAPIILKSHKTVPGEVMIISSQVGINSLTIDAAEESKKRGLKVVGVESRELCDMVPQGYASRHPSGKNLHDIADVTIDAKIPYGDGVVEIEGADQKTGPVSNILIFFVLNSLIIRTVEKLIEKGANPPMWKSANIPGGDEENARYLDEYGARVKAL